MPEKPRAKRIKEEASIFITQKEMLALLSKS